MPWKSDDKGRRDGLGVALVWGLLGLVSRLPLRFHLRVFRLVSWFLEKILHYRRDELMINLSRSFPDKKYKELKQIRHRAYVRMGDLMAEAVWFSGNRNFKKGRRRLHESRIGEIVNPEVLNDLYDRCPGVMILCGHSGNWEILGGILNMAYGEGFEWHFDEGDLAFVYKRLHSHLWDRIMDKNRCCVLYANPRFDGYRETNSILRYALEHRDQKKVYVFPTDQYPYKGAKGQDIGTFMHQSTKAMVGGAALAAKMKMGVVYTRWSILERGRYTLEFIPIATDASAMTPVDIMKEYYRLLQEDLERQSENYLWTHKRWK